MTRGRRRSPTAWCASATAGSARSGSGHGEALVVGRGGWVHLPERAASERDRAHVRAEQEGDGIVLRDRARHARPAGRRAAAAAAGRRARWSPSCAGVQGVRRARACSTASDAEFRRGADGGGRPVGNGQEHAAAHAGRAGAARRRRGAGLRRAAGRARPQRARRPAPAAHRRRSGRSRDWSRSCQRRGERRIHAGSLRGVAGRRGRRARGRALAEVGLGARASQRASRLSAGERQRMAIARALVGRPRPAAGGRADVAPRPGERRAGRPHAGRRRRAAHRWRSSAPRTIPLLIECAGVRMRLDDDVPESTEGRVTGAGAGTMS